MNKKTKARRSKDSSRYVALIIVILGCLGTTLGFYMGVTWAAEYGGILKNFGIVISYALCGAQIGFCGTALIALLVKLIKEILQK